MERFADPSSMVSHRPWPMPARPWVIRMRWSDLLFAHWPVAESALRALVPPALAIDTFDGTAWLGIVPFRMQKTGVRGLPRIPTASEFPELNVRTYVTAGGRPGVWFFSLDAASRLAVAAARAAFHLPYRRASMRIEREGGRVRYRSTRSDAGAPAASCDVAYEPSGEPFTAAEGSLDHFLTSRYCLYSADRRSRIHRVDVHHAPWRLQAATASFAANTYAVALGVDLPAAPPLLRFSRALDVVAWMPERIVIPG